MATMVNVMGIGRHAGTKEIPLVGSAAHGKVSVAKNLLLFFAAPLIGLAYIIAFPFVGTVAMVRIALRH